MKLVSDVRNWWRWHTTYFFAFLAVFPAAWLASPDLQALLPPKVVSAIAPCIGVLGFLLRIRQQALAIPPPKPPSGNDFSQRSPS